MNDNECILKTANDILQNHPKGSSELNLDPIDPLKILNMTVEQKSGLVKVLAKLQNFNIEGFSKGKFSQFEGFNQGMLKIKMRAEKVKINSIYDVDGLILILPIKGYGNCKMTFGKTFFTKYFLKQF